MFLRLKKRAIATREKRRYKIMNFYLVTTKCGHVGKNSYIPIIFPVKAENGREAASLARHFPRVKHNHWDAILECRKVEEKVYREQIAINSKDPFLKVGSKQEQNLFMGFIKDRIQEDKHQLEMNKSPRKTNKPNLSYQKLKYISIDEDEYLYEDYEF